VLAALRRETSTAQTVPVLRVGSAHPTLPGALLADPLVQIPAFGPVNRLPRRNRRSRIAVGIRRRRPRRDRQNGHRHRNNHPEDEHEPVRFRCHVFLLAPDRCAVADVEVERRDICDARHTGRIGRSYSAGIDGQNRARLARNVGARGGELRKQKPRRSGAKSWNGTNVQTRSIQWRAFYGT